MTRRARRLLAALGVGCATVGMALALWPRRPALLARARLVTSVSGWAAHGDYEWLSDHELIRLERLPGALRRNATDVRFMWPSAYWIWPGASVPVRAVYLDTASGSTRPLGVDMRIDARAESTMDSGGFEWAVCANGRRLLWTDARQAPGHVRVATFDGKLLGEWQCARDLLPVARSARWYPGGAIAFAWMADGERWASARLATGFPVVRVLEATVMGSTTAAPPQRTIAVLGATDPLDGWAAALQPVTVSVTDDGTLVALMRKPIAVPPSGTDPAAQQDRPQDPMVVLTIAPGEGAEPRRSAEITLPAGHFLSGVTLSPSGTRAAWTLYSADSSPLPFSLPGAPTGRLQMGQRARFSIWTSRLDGSPLREVGGVVVRPPEPRAMALPTQIRWRPGEREISFILGDRLYTAPVTE